MAALFWPPTLFTSYSKRFGRNAVLSEPKEIRGVQIHEAAMPPGLVGNIEDVEVSTTALRQPMFYLIDDDQNSAAFLMRKLDNAETRFGVQCQWFNSAESGREMVLAIASTTSQDRPDLIIVDLKASSQANENFLASVAENASSAGVPLVTMVNSADTDKRAALRRAGADEIFERPADVIEYRSEVKRLIEFSAQSKRAG